jgi:hypothetical protein
MVTGTGSKIIIHPGTYQESPTITMPNVSISSVAPEQGGITFVSGSFTINNNGTSIRVHGIAASRFVISGSGNVYLDNVSVYNQFAKVGAGYMEVLDSIIQPSLGISLSAGTNIFQGGNIAGIAQTGASTTTIVKNAISLTYADVSAGTFAVTDSPVYSPTSGSNAIRSSAGTIVQLFNSQIATLTGIPERVSLGGFFGYSNISFNRNASTLSGTNLNLTADFQTIRANNLIGTASYATFASQSVFATTASFIATASYALMANTASYVLNAVSASYAVSASFSNTASIAQLARTASYALVFPYTGSANISGSVNVDGYFNTTKNVIQLESNLVNTENLYIGPKAAGVEPYDIFANANSRNLIVTNGLTMNPGVFTGGDNVVVAAGDSFTNIPELTNMTAVGTQILPLLQTASDKNIVIGSKVLPTHTENLSKSVIIANNLDPSDVSISQTILINGDASAITELPNTSVYIGTGIIPSTGSAQNEIVIGNISTGQGSNTIMIGNDTYTDAYWGDRTISAWSTTSDARDKINITTLTEGLSFINQITPVQYEWNRRDGSLVGKKQIGFTAQNLLSAQTGSAIQDHLYLVNASNPNQLTVNQSDLIPILVKAIQDLSAEVETLKQQLNP